MNWLLSLAIASLKDPQGTARRIIDWQLDRQTLYSALIAAVAVNAILVSGPIVMAGGDIDPQAIAALPIIGLLGQPLLIFGLMASGVVILAHVLVWVSRIVGGTGQAQDMLVLLVWLQILRVVGNILLLVVALVIPLVANLLALFIGIATLWLLVHFITAALKLTSVWAAIPVLIGCFVAVVLGLSLVLSIMGVDTLGGVANV